MPRVYRYGGTPGFVVDYESTTRVGRQIDFTKVPDTFRITEFPVTTSGGAAAGTTSVPVTALAGAIPVGTALDFGTTSVSPVVATGGAAIGATTVPVVALTGPLPAEAILDFGGGKLVELSAAAATGATSLAVDALEAALVAGDTATYVEAKYAEIAAPASKGDTTLTVKALPQTLVTGDVATYAGSDALFGFVGHKFIPGGTIMAQLSSGLVIPRAAVTDGSLSSGLLISGAEEWAVQDAKTGNGLFVGGAFYQDMLPDRLNANFNTWLTELGNVKPGIRFEIIADSRATGALPFGVGVGP